MGLRLEGFEVSAAQTADQAMDLLDCEPVDLAMLDLMMPGINGIELARRVRQRHPSVRVILTSAYHLSERQLTRADCGVVGFVPKPFEFVELASLIRAKLAPISRTVVSGPTREVGGRRA